MAKKKNPPPRYRDRKTGRFVSKKTWQRSQARGRTRYKREIPQRRRKLRKAAPEKAPRLGPLPIYEWIVSFSYSASSRILDVIATAQTDNEAIEKAIDFLRKDPRAKHIVENLEKFEITAARGKKVPRHRRTKYRRDSRA